MHTKDLTRRATIHEMHIAFHEARDRIRRAHRLLAEAQEMLISSFLGSTYTFDVNPDGLAFRTVEEKLEQIESGLKASAWRVIVQRLEVLGRMSCRDARRLQEQIQNGEMPEITGENIWAFVQEIGQRLGEFQAEAIREGFELLRPGYIVHKTNMKNARFEIGPKVILTGWVELNPWGRFSISHYREQEFRVLQNTFSLLDGQGCVKSYKGELADAIERETRTGATSGETTYFRWKVFKNGNLHLEFRRMDLVQKLNEAGGAGRLRQSA